MTLLTISVLLLLSLGCGADTASGSDTGPAGGDSGTPDTGTTDTDTDTDTDTGTPSTGTTDTEPSCIDSDGDGYGEDCDAGPDCDDDVASCNTDCADADASGTADCAETVGDGVYLYNGAGGGAYDIDEPELEALYRRAGIEVAVGGTIPAGMVDSYGTLVLLSPTSGFAPSLTSAGESLLARGGRVVVVTEHSGYGDHEGAAAYLAGLGSTLAPFQEKHSGTVPVALTPVAPLTDGVSSLELFYTAAVDPGAGQVVATEESGDVVIAYERVDRGDVVVVCDGSFFGYVLEREDNATFVLNLATLRTD